MCEGYRSLTDESQLTKSKTYYTLSGLGGLYRLKFTGKGEDGKFNFDVVTPDFTQLKLTLNLNQVLEEADEKNS